MFIKNNNNFALHYPSQMRKIVRKRQWASSKCENSYSTTIVLKGVYMKRLCKDVDITDIEFIKQCINKCLKNKSKKRRDIAKLYKSYQSLDELAIEIQQEIINRNLNFPPIWTKEIVDASSLKIRTIGIQNIKQQIYDYIAVTGLDELTKRIGMYQCSYKGKGQVYGAKAIYK